MKDPTDSGAESRYRVVPHALAFAYYQLPWILYTLNPRWSYG